jgi:hypothetical protein
MVLPMLPYICTVFSATTFAARPICSLTAEITQAGSAGSGSSSAMAAYIAMLRDCPIAIKLSPALCCST